MSLKSARLPSLADKLEKQEALETLSELEKEEAKLKASKRPAHKKLKD